MRTYHYKVQTSAFGLFLGLTAETVRPEHPPTTGHRVSDRIWLEASHVIDTFRDKPLSLNDCEVEWLLFGLRKVSDDIEFVETNANILIAVRALETVEADYAEAALAPALAGWAEAEFGLTPHRGRITRSPDTGLCLFQWED